MEEDRYTRMTLRLPRELHEKLAKAGDETSKSTNAEIVARLELSFEQDKSTDKVFEMFNALERSYRDKERQLVERIQVLRLIVQKIVKNFQFAIAAICSGKQLTKDQIKRMEIDVDDAVSFQKILDQSLKYTSHLADDDDEELEFPDVEQEEPGIRIKKSP